MPVPEKGFSIEREDINEFFQLLRSRTEPWEEGFFPSSKVRAEIDLPNFRMRVRAGRNFIYLNGSLLETDGKFIVKWSTEFDPLHKSFTKYAFIGIWLILLITYVVPGGKWGPLGPVGPVIAGTAMSAMMGLGYLISKEEFRRMSAELEQVLRTIAQDVRKVPKRKHEM